MENISLHFSSKEVDLQVQVLLKLMDGSTESFQNCQDNFLTYNVNICNSSHSRGVLKQ